VTATVPEVAFSLDAPTMSAVVDEQWTPLTRLATLLLGDGASAEDVVQDACEATWRVQPTVDDRDHLIAYLRTAVVNRCRSAGRRRGTVHRFLASVRPPDDAPAADVPVLAAESDSTVLAALARLAPRQREVLVLRYWSELSEREIAQTLGIAPGTVKSTASDALARLNTLLGDLR
jgi:RNA polymerase sigma-70 factor (sigma-E family)